MQASRPADTYSPLYFLASLGAGGIGVTFFLWLYFWVKHPGQPVPINEDIVAAFLTGGPAMKAMILFAVVAILVFAYLNIRYLVWNLRELSSFKRTEAYAQLRASNAETQLMAMPLALAMTINVGFVLGLVFVPGLWGVVEYLFPLAIAAFFAVGVLAMTQLGNFLGRVKTEGGFDWTANGSFAQMLPAFALSMVGVGLAAPAAMSALPATSAVAMVLAIFFLIAAAVVGMIALVFGMHSMLSHGVTPEAAPTLLIVIPILTVLGILMLRVDHGLHEHLKMHAEPGATLLLLTKLLSVQIIFGLLGLEILKRVGYVGRFLTGPENSVGAYALICPGVAFGVLTQFWINPGLVGSGLVTKFSAVYWALTLVAIFTQVAMVALFVRLNRRHFGHNT